MAIYSYARVLTDDQTLAVQDAELHAAGCAKVYIENGTAKPTPAIRLTLGDVREPSLEKSRDGCQKPVFRFGRGSEILPTLHK
jgi:hypothetical protein